MSWLRSRNTCRARWYLGRCSSSTFLRRASHPQSYSCHNDRLLRLPGQRLHSVVRSKIIAL